MARFTFAILVLVAAGAVFFFGVVSSWRDVRLLQAEADTLATTSARLESLQQKRDALTREYNAIPREDLAKLSLMLPAGADTAQFLREMEVLTGQHGMVLNSIDFLKADRSSDAGLQVPIQHGYAPIGVTLGM